MKEDLVLFVYIFLNLFNLMKEVSDVKVSKGGFSTIYFYFSFQFTKNLVLFVCLVISLTASFQHD